MRTLLLLLAAIILLASCTRTYRVQGVGSSVIQLVDLDKGFQVGDTVIYKEKSLSFGEHVVILNLVK